MSDVRQALEALRDPEVAARSQRFFKTGPGEYGEGDRFLGIRVPQLRTLARAHRALPLGAVVDHLRSAWHEERLLALLILIEQHRRGDAEARERIHRLYLDHTRYVNNWDLVDTSAPLLVGAHVDPRAPELLDLLAESESVWERRIAVLATFHWIGQGEVDAALRIADRLLGDPHDLIHKAVGWMVREAGKRDPERFRGVPRPALPTDAAHHAPVRDREAAGSAPAAVPAGGGVTVGRRPRVGAPKLRVGRCSGAWVMTRPTRTPARAPLPSRGACSMTYSCELVDQQAQRTLVVRTRAAVERLPHVLGPAWGQVMACAKKAGATPSDAPYIAYHNMDMQDLDLEIGFAFAQPLAGEGDVQAGEIPAGQAAQCVHVGPFDQMGAAYEALQAFVAGRGLQPSGPSYEYYLDDPDEVPLEQLRTRVVMPVR